MAAALSWTVLVLLVTLGASSPARNASRAADASSCVLPGLFCLDCVTLGVCVQVQGKFVLYVMDTCDAAAPCSQSLKACSDKSSYCTSGDEFECTQPGYFPDPFDCNVYHECGAPPSDDADVYPAVAAHTCDIATAFNPKSGRCDLAEGEANCEEGSYPVPKCEGSGFTAGPFDLDPSYYWICVGGVLHVHKCDEGFVFEVAPYYRCIPGEVDGDLETTTEGYAESSTSAVEGYQCSGTGMEPDPSSCSKYYDCSDKANPIHLSCLWGKYFHQRKGRCVLGFCPS